MKLNEAIGVMRRWIARQLEIPSDTQVKTVGREVEAMRILLAEMVEARAVNLGLMRDRDEIAGKYAAAAIPWRDGPAKGGEMPEGGDKIIVAEMQDGRCVSGFMIALTGDYSTFRTHDGAESGRHIHRFFYLSDLVPAADAKGVEP